MTSHRAPVEEFEILEDSESSWGNKGEGLGFEAILWNQVSRITKILSQDLRPGHWKNLPIRTGTGAVLMHSVYIPDGRKEAINSIMCLKELLIPRFDDEMKEDYKSIMNRLQLKKKSLKEMGKTQSDLLLFEVKIYRLIFEKLNLLIARLGYLKEGEATA